MCKDIWHHARYARNMAISMAKTIQEERMRWITPIMEGNTRLIDVIRICPYSRRSLLRWMAIYRLRGKEGLIPKSTAPYTSPHETPIHQKERIIALRKKRHLCAMKLHWILKEEGIYIPARTIHKILKQEGVIRTYRKRKTKYVYVKAERIPGELIEIDVKYVPGRVAGKRYFQYTAIDCASRWRHLRIFEEYGTYESVAFLKEVIEKFPHPIHAVKTDNGAPFTNYYLGTHKRSDMTVKHLHALDVFCGENNIIHYLIDPGKPAQNGTVERSHRSDQESFYERNTFFSPSDLKRKLRMWNTEYNNLVHCGLKGRSPNQFLREYQLQKVSNVIA